MRGLADMLQPLRTALRNMARRALVQLLDDGAERQRVQLLIYHGELREIERWQDFGRSSHPPKGSAAIVLNLGSHPDHMVAICVEHGASRPRNLAEGEQILFDAFGDKFIHFRADGTLHIKATKLLLEGVEQLETRAPYLKQFASQRHRLDVAGYASEIAYSGGATWQQTAWNIGATVTAEAEPIAPPEVMP